MRKRIKQREFTYLTLLSEFGRRNCLFTSAETKVLLTLLAHLDYSLRQPYVSIALRRLQAFSGLGKGKLLRALESLEKLGLIKKISGRDEKEKALALREQVFKKKQKKTRAGCEVNVYDLSNFIYFIRELAYLDDSFFHSYLRENYTRPPLEELPSLKLSKLRKACVDDEEFNYLDALREVEEDTI